VQSIFLAGRVIQCGGVIGASDEHSAYLSHTPQTPENFCAAIFRFLGVP